MYSDNNLIIVRQYFIGRSPPNNNNNNNNNNPFLYTSNNNCNNNNNNFNAYSSSPITGGFFASSSSGLRMGAFLDKPKTEKINECGQGANGALHYGLAAMQGWRIEMEDAHTAKTSLPVPLQDWAFFAVFDGHAGGKVAKYSAAGLVDAILQTSEMKTFINELQQQQSSSTTATMSSSSTSLSSSSSSPLSLDSKQVELITKGLKMGFLTFDEKMRQMPHLHGENERSGTTAVCALVAPGHIFLANLGDSRALVSRAGTVHFSTEDHKPYLPKERERIVNAGGSVMIQRVNGSLAVSRALGDYEYKNVPGFSPCEQLVSPEPDVYTLERDRLNGTDEFLLLACDGVFDVMTNQELCDFIRSRLRVTTRLDVICNQILDSCLSKGSKDNMSVILVTFPGAPKVDSEAVNKEKEFEAQLRQRILDVVQLCDNEDDIDGEYVLRILLNQEIPGVPPGAGLHAMRSSVDSILESLKTKKSQSQSATTPQPSQQQQQQQQPQQNATTKGSNKS